MYESVVVELALTDWPNTKPRGISVLSTVSRYPTVLIVLVRILNNVVTVEATSWQGPFEIFLDIESRALPLATVVVTISNSVLMVDLILSHLPPATVLIIPPIVRFAVELTNVWGFWLVEGTESKTWTLIVVPVTAVIVGAVIAAGSVALG